MVLFGAKLRSEFRGRASLERGVGFRYLRLGFSFASYMQSMPCEPLFAASRMSVLHFVFKVQGGRMVRVSYLGLPHENPNALRPK